MRSNLIEQYTNILKTIVYLNSVSQSNGTLVESVSNLYNHIIKKTIDANENDIIHSVDSIAAIDSSVAKEQSSNTADENNNSINQQQKILAVMNYLKFTGFIDYYIDNMKKDKITITISPVISAFLLQYYFEILNVLDTTHHSSVLLKDPKHKEDEKILLLQKLFVSSSMLGPGAAGASQSSSMDF
jgi:hypothetical protein